MTGKKVYLTIDDVPSRDFREKLDFLYKRNIPAVFFCVGKDMENHEEDLVEAVRRGYILGNHSYEHGYFSEMQLVECRASIQRTDEIIDRVYRKSGIERTKKFFRFPYFDQGGSADSKSYEARWSRPQSEWFVYEREDRRLAIQEFLKELGYSQPRLEGINMKFLTDKTLLEGIDVRCTFDQMEYFFGTDYAPYGMDKEAAILARIEEDVPYGGRALNCLETTDIVLVHDHENTTELFYKIIGRYVEKGFEFLRF
ncbi:MAG: polysaccharide deacetylase family protein [Bacillota bacterium]|nr:polysaccharide deacetylase family protein [Bacillota bacterium]